MDIEKQTCYRCNRVATSKEHVPPKSLFPELKDNPEKDFRKNLITVPSCEIHNTRKTKDDEFLLICLACSIHVNKAGLKHFNTKIRRALKRKGIKFTNEIFRDKEILITKDQEGNAIQVLKGKANLPRLNNCLESILFGLYFHEFKQKFNGKIKIFNDFIISENDNQINFLKLVEGSFKNDKKSTDILGTNSPIFRYQFAGKDSIGLIGAKLTFYGGLNVYASFIPLNTEIRKNLGSELINNGIPTIFEFPDGNIKFNNDKK